MFQNCRNLRTIYVEDGCEADLFDARMQNSTEIGPLPETTINGVGVWDLRNCKEVSFPEGTEKIESYWFYGSKVESIIVPASVREIGA